MSDPCAVYIPAPVPPGDLTTLCNNMTPCIDARVLANLAAPTVVVSLAARLASYTDARIDTKLAAPALTADLCTRLQTCIDTRVGIYGASFAFWTATRAQALVATIPPYVTAVNLDGYTVTGDSGGGLYVSVPDIGPLLATEFRSSGTTRRWRLAETNYRPEQFGAVANGVYNSTTAIQAAIDAQEALGGGDVIFSQGVYCVNALLRVKRSGVRLVGKGRDTSHDYTPPWPSFSNTAWVTTLLWTGLNGAVMIAIEPYLDNDNGGGLGGNGVLRMNLAAGVFPFTNVAAYGVQVRACRGGEYDLFTLEFGVAGLYFGALDRNAAWQNSTWFNTVHYLGSRNVSTNGGALKLDGVSLKGNAYNNTFHVIEALHTGGTAIDLFSCDNNTFHQVRIQRAGGVGTGVIFRSAATFDAPARANIFYLLSPGAGGAYSDASLGWPAYENKILFYNPDENGAPAIPAIGTNSTLYVGNTKRVGGSNFLTRLSANQSVPSGALTKLAFNASVIDPSTWYVTASSRWRPRYPGTYLMNVTVYVTTTAAVGNTQLTLLASTGESYRVLRRNTSAGADSLTLTAIVTLNGTTDYVEAFLEQDTGAAATVSLGNNETFFTGTRAI